VAVPHFAVEVERLADASLRNRPLVVGGSPEERREVVDCSVEAMACGVRQGMPLREALSRCSGAAFVEAHSSRYQGAMEGMALALLELSPLVELAGPGAIYLGVDGKWPESHAPVKQDDESSSRFLLLGSPSDSSDRSDPLEEQLARDVIAAVESSSGLRVRLGMADGKFVAYVAAMLSEGTGAKGRAGGEQRRRIVPSGDGATFVAGLAIDDLPVSAEMRRRLRLFGLRRLGELARLPKGAVTAQFGSEGTRAWDLAHGVDRAPIVPYRPPRSISEQLAFPAPVDTLGALLAAGKALLWRGLQRPESRGRAVRGLRLRVVLEDGRTWERTVTFREPVGNGERMLVALKQKIEVGERELPAPFTEVELTLFGLCGESALQGNLFRTERGRQLERVAEAARQLKARFGRPILNRVVEVEPWSRIPERRFALIDYDP
jgi:DNA polymerase-4/protein ImuB